MSLETNIDWQAMYFGLQRELDEARQDRQEHVAALESDRGLLLAANKDLRERAEKAEAQRVLVSQMNLNQANTIHLQDKQIATLTEERDDAQRLAKDISDDSESLQRENATLREERDAARLPCYCCEQHGCADGCRCAARSESPEQ